MRLFRSTCIDPSDSSARRASSLWASDFAQRIVGDAHRQAGGGTGFARQFVRGIALAVLSAIFDLGSGGRRSVGADRSQAAPTERRPPLEFDRRIVGQSSFEARLAWTRGTTLGDRRPCDSLSLEGRGFLREGAWADVLVIDRTRLRAGSARLARDFPADTERYVVDADASFASFANFASLHELLIRSFTEADPP